MASLTTAQSWTGYAERNVELAKARGVRFREEERPGVLADRSLSDEGRTEQLARARDLALTVIQRARHDAEVAARAVVEHSTEALRTAETGSSGDPVVTAVREEGARAQVRADLDSGVDAAHVLERERQAGSLWGVRALREQVRRRAIGSSTIEGLGLDENVNTTATLKRIDDVELSLLPAEQAELVRFLRWWEKRWAVLEYELRVTEEQLDSGPSLESALNSYYLKTEPDYRTTEPV